MTSDEYVKSGAGCCPNCGGSDISGGFIEVDGDSASQPVDCLDCGAHWYDDYKLVGYSYLEKGHHEEMVADMQSALVLLNLYIMNGVEFPDAAYKAAGIWKVDQKVLEQAYDAQYEDGGTRP